MDIFNNLNIITTKIFSSKYSAILITTLHFQCAYLVGISDPASELGQSGLIDERDFLAANEAIQTSCDHLENPSSSHNQVQQILFFTC